MDSCQYDYFIHQKLLRSYNLIKEGIIKTAKFSYIKKKNSS